MARPAISTMEDIIEVCTRYENMIKDDLSKVYFITWNPKPKFYGHSFSGHNDFNLQWETMIMEVIKKVIRCSKCFCLIPEVSIKGKLHLHGWIRIDDKVKWNKATYPMFVRTGMAKVSKAKCMKGFYYYKKEVDSILEYLPGFILPVTPDTLPWILTDIRMRYAKKFKKLGTSYKSIDITKFFMED